MKKDYMRAYYDVLKKIENIILTCEIPDRVLERLLPYVEKFTLDIHKNYSEYEYILNMSNLMYIYNKLVKYRKNNISTGENEDILALENKILKTKGNLVKNQNIKYKIWLELVTAITITATLISIPINFIKNNKPTKTQYSTRTMSYALVEDLSSPLAHLNLREDGSNLKSDDTLLYEFYNKNEGVIRVSTNYEDLLPYISNLIVKKYEPWETSNDQATRKVTTYEITDANMVNLFNIRTISDYLVNNDGYNLHKIIYKMLNSSDILANSKSSSTIETKKTTTIDKTSQAYYEPYYEFMIINQDLNDSIEVEDYHSLVDYLLLVVEEILIYAVATSIFNNTLLTTYFEKLSALAMCYKLNEKEKKKLNSLLRAYNKLLKASNKETGIIKKRLLI